MSSIKKSTRRPVSWKIARKLTISASARAAAGVGGAGLAGSAAGCGGGDFWGAASSRPIRTRTDSAKLASVRYGRKGSVAVATATPFASKISRTPTIRATLIAGCLPLLLSGALNMGISDHNLRNHELAGPGTGGSAWSHPILSALSPERLLAAGSAHARL